MFGKKPGDATPIALPAAFSFRRLSVVIGVCCSLLGIAVGVALAALGDIIGWPILVFSIIFFFMVLRGARDGRPVIEIDAHGLIDRRHMSRPVPWGEIRHIEELPSAGGNWFLLHVADPLAWVDSPWRRLSIRLNGLFLGRRCLYMTNRGLTCSRATLRDTIQAGMAAYGKANTSEA